MIRKDKKYFLLIIKLKKISEILINKLRLTYNRSLIKIEMRLNFGEKANYLCFKMNTKIIRLCLKI